MSEENLNLSSDESSDSSSTSLPNTPLMESPEVVPKLSRANAHVFRRSPTPMREEEQKVKQFNIPLGIFLICALATTAALSVKKVPSVPYSVDEIANFMRPEQVWPLVCFTGLLVVTLEVLYFPTAISLLTYAGLMVNQFGFPFTNIQTISGVAGYLVLAVVWFVIKFWTFLRESESADEI